MPPRTRKQHSASRVSDSLSGHCVRGDHLDYQLSDPTWLLVEREVARVGDRDEGHMRAILERAPLVVGQSDIVVLAEHDPRPGACIAQAGDQRAVVVQVVEVTAGL